MAATNDPGGVRPAVDLQCRVKVRLERLSFTMARWVEGEAVPLAQLESSLYGYGALDIHANPVVLFKGEWQLTTCAKAFPNTRFVELGGTAGGAPS